MKFLPSANNSHLASSKDSLRSHLSSYLKALPHVFKDYIEGIWFILFRLPELSKQKVAAQRSDLYSRKKIR